jgi:hypothetical protein
MAASEGRRRFERTRQVDGGSGSIFESGVFSIDGAGGGAEERGGGWRRPTQHGTGPAVDEEGNSAGAGDAGGGAQGG